MRFPRISEHLGLDRQTIERILTLSQLSLDDDAVQQLSSDLDAILGFFEVMNDVATDDVEPLAHAVEIDQQLRPDDAKTSVDRDTLQALAPETADGMYLVPKVLETR